MHHNDVQKVKLSDFVMLNTRCRFTAICILVKETHIWAYLLNPKTSLTDDLFSLHLPEA